MMLLKVFLSTCYLLSVVQSQVYNSQTGVNDLTPFNQFRRQLSNQQHILTDVQQHHTQQVPQSLNNELLTTPHQQQQRNRLIAGNNDHPSNIHDNQFTRSQQLNLEYQPQQPNLDLHTQNFLTLRNYANQQGPPQALPQRPSNNKVFPTSQPQYQPHQYSSVPVNPYQHQNQPGFAQALPQTQQKLPSQLPVPNFRINSPPQKPIHTIPQFNVHQQSNQQQFQKQQRPNFQYTPNLGLPVPEIFPQSPTGVPPSSLPLQHQQPLQQHLPQFLQSQQSNQYSNISPPQEADPEYKQKLIQKHEQFVQKQYEKSQHKVRQQHEEFLAKQQNIKQQLIPSILGNNQDLTNYNQKRGRPIAPSEYPLFSSALRKYNEDHPTTTTTTELTTAPLKANKDIYAEVKAEIGKFGQKTSFNSKKPAKTIGRDELLKQLKAALAESPQKSLGNKTYDEMDLVLPNGERVQVIRTTDPNLVQGQQGFSQDQFQTFLANQGAQGKLSLSDVAPEKTKDLVLPNGSKVQILRSPVPQESDSPPEGVDLSKLASLYGGEIAGVSSNPNSIASSAVIQSDSDEPPSLEELAKRGLIPEGYEIEGLSSPSKEQPKPPPTLPPKKKATYVYLEEQADGSFKIQGVKANGEKETKQTGAEVESILERIRNGEIKLPPSVQRLTLPNDEVVNIIGGNIIQTTLPPKITELPPTAAPLKNTTLFESARLTHSQHRSTAGTTVPPAIQRSSAPSQQESIQNYASTENTQSFTYNGAPIPTVYGTTTTSKPVTQSQYKAEEQHYSDAVMEETENREKSSKVEAITFTNPTEDLIQILKTNGLYAMAKYLRQSGLDSILNETGPYTVFVPTDKAFKNLLVQLGGPERAEEKFKANPRLLSGLLLHHVIPGAFEIAALQDEMTGVSLAGTQLRVNQYTMHDQEWNDVTLTTINGAMIVLNKKDIKIPQGIAHAVDRVMFPLPVGDLLQTLQSDRENRFTTFLKILYTSGLSEKLQSKGVKTYTVFAPVDKCFKEIESDTLEKLLNDKNAAEEFAMKHIVSGTLFSAGMRFYQVKDALLTGKTVVLQKTSAGKIKVNDAQMVTSNIPATNGVIHAIDGVLA